MSEQFKREKRYSVIKIRTGRPVECVVVESDWPEYEIVWKMIQDRVEGKPNELIELRNEISRLTAQVAMQMEVLERASTSLGAFCGDEGWAQTDMDTMDSVDYTLSATAETVAAWKRENAKDIARLNWIEDRKESVYSVWNVERYRLTDGSNTCAERQVFSGWSCGSRLDEEDTARAAIDKAMRGQHERQRIIGTCGKSCWD